MSLAFEIGLTIILLCILILQSIHLGIMITQRKTVETTVVEKPVVELDEKAKKEAEKRLRNKQYIDEEQSEQDEAVRDFIARGGLPK